MRKDGTLKRLLSFTKPYRGYLAGALFSAVASVSLTLLAPVISGNAIDYIIGPGQVDFKNVFSLLIWLAATVAGVAVFQWLMTLCTNTVTYRTVRDLRKAVFEKLEDVPLSYIDSHPHGDLISRVANDIDQISDGLLQGFSQLFTGIITIVGTLGFMLYVDIPIALVVVVLTPLSFFVASFIAKGTYNMFREQSATKGELSGYIDEMIGNQKVVKAFSFEERAQEEFEEINQRLYKCGVKAQFYSALTNPCTRFVNSVVYAAVGIVGALSVISGRLTVGQLSCFLTYANQYTKPFNEISGVITEFQAALACARRVFAVLDEPEEAEESPKVLEHCKGSVQLQDVSFSYSETKPLIENLNLHAQPGQRIAIVGPTGCGKTTIINLLMRFYDVDSGSIRVSGQDIRQVTRASLRGSYGMVLQDTWLRAGTIRENIAYGRPDATEAVSFSYSETKPLIENLNLHAQPGQRIAIVGPTGCGKTTIINLLMRFYDPKRGEILVDGTDIRDVTRASLRGMYGMVLQDTWLFAGTVRDNIAYGKPNAPLEEIAAAAKAAHADSFIRRLPQGYDTVLAEDGGNLSQGQKQLMCIARIMLTDPPMLILDEATSSIDTRTEIRVQRAFEKMMAGRTSFIVAHRLSTIKNADSILVMRDGHIVEQGKHEQLLAKGGFYAELYNSQFVPSDL